MNIIDKKIKDIYKDKAVFYKKMGYDYKNGARKIKQFITKINSLNEFLSHLNLKIHIVEIEHELHKTEVDK